MKPFLEQVADHIINKHQHKDLNPLCVVLPNKRAGVFFKAYLTNKLESSEFSPDVLSIEEFTAQLSGKEIIDQVSALFSFYSVYKDIEGKKAAPFDEFSKWGHILLKDFNDLDNYLVPADRFFKGLRNVKSVEQWSLNEEDLSQFQEQYIGFWDSMGSYYKQFRLKLEATNLAYQGLANRLAAEQPAVASKHNQWNKVIFAGFNALTSSEEKIIDDLITNKLAEIIWDADEYYLKDPKQEAGRFIRKFMKKWKGFEFRWTGTELLESKKTIDIIGVPKHVGQAKIAASLLENLKNKANKETTAVVLSDEQLLLPFLHAVPENVRHLNVTMGYPLKNTPLAGLFNTIFKMQENGHNLAKPVEKSFKFYHRDLMQVLDHPYIRGYHVRSGNKDLFQNNINISEKVAVYLRNNNIIFISPDDIRQLLKEIGGDQFDLFGSLFFDWADDPNKALSSINSLINELKENFLLAEEIEGLELEYLLAFSKIVKRLQSLVDENNFIENIATLRNIFNQLLRNSSLPFYGEPLKGLQVMGTLETRALDFDTVIMLSVNEGILPAGKSESSFIPYDMKREFGLPTYTDKDSIFAYHFYRLLQRTKQAYFLYNSELEDFKTGEMSRFLTQIINELPERNPQVKIQERHSSFPMLTPAVYDDICIEKSGDIAARLKEIGGVEKGLSPSMLNTYRNCSLQFYFQQVTKIREDDVVEETIEASTLGSVVHAVLESIYKPAIGTPLTIDFINEAEKNVEDRTIKTFRRLYTGSELHFGKNLLIVKVALKFIRRFLAWEKQNLAALEKDNKVLVIDHLEKKLETTLKIGDHLVYIKGNADRIDRIDGTTRVIDYKTGRVKSYDLKFDNWTDLRTNASLDKCFQLLSYAWLYSLDNNGKPLIPGIISFPELSSGFLNMTIEKQEGRFDEKVKSNFENELRQLLQELYSTEYSFTQTEDRDNCKYCSYKGICNR